LIVGRYEEAPDPFKFVPTNSANASEGAAGDSPVKGDSKSADIKTLLAKVCKWNPDGRDDPMNVFFIFLPFFFFSFFLFFFLFSLFFHPMQASGIEQSSQLLKLSYKNEECCALIVETGGRLLVDAASKSKEEGVLANLMGCMWNICLNRQ
jgi:hypothetical protein